MDFHGFEEVQAFNLLKSALIRINLRLSKSARLRRPRQLHKCTSVLP
jgi:hypothetical protein